jgi:hypothetical protein
MVSGTRLYLDDYFEEYHQWALETLQQIDAEARGDRATFLRLFEELIASPVVTDPDMLDASWWRGR